MTPEQMDQEANAFAVELLMPEFILRPLLGKFAIEFPDGGEALTSLAKKFGVPRELMALRIGQLLMEPVS